jgi:hypothetical protein
MQATTTPQNLARVLVASCHQLFDPLGFQHLA